MRFRFCFGYETPDQYENNRLHGWDDEDSHFVWIEANTRDEAMVNGLRFARGFVEKLYADRNQPMPFDWNENTYAWWIEDDPK